MNKNDVSMVDDVNDSIMRWKIQLYASIWFEKYKHSARVNIKQFTILNYNSNEWDANTIRQLSWIITESILLYSHCIFISYPITYRRQHLTTKKRYDIHFTFVCAFIRQNISHYISPDVCMTKIMDLKSFMWLRSESLLLLLLFIGYWWICWEK